MRARHQIIGAVISGVLVCFSFPTVLFGWHAPELGWLAWFALVPLLTAVRDASPRRAFAMTFVTGFVAYSGSLYWIYRAINTFGGLPSVTSVLVLGFLIVVLSAYTAIAPMLARFVQTRWRGEFIALVPAFWVAVEFVRNYGPAGGFPWADVAMSQWRVLPVIQIVDLVGIYGLIFLIVWVNCCLAEIAARLAGRQVRQLSLKISVTILLIAATLGYGSFRLHTERGRFATAGELKIGMVQANIPQEDKWDESKATENLNAYRTATRDLRDAAVDLIIWPESSFPWPIDTRALRIDPVALGFDRDELGPMPYLMMGAISSRPDGEYHNSVILFDAQGSVRARYHKRHLVPLGEYVPYRELLFFAEKLTAPVGNFRAGKSLDPVEVGESKAGPLVCYEDIFPEISRGLVKRGAEYLVNVTNDAWYGVSSAPYQHLALAVFRAVENRRFMIRATNTGVSAVIAPTGSIDMESGIFHDAIIVAPVGLKREMTLYTEMGDWFAWACFAYVALGLIMVVIIKVRKRCGR